MTLKDRLIIYIAKKNDLLEFEKENLIIRMRHPLDSLDLYEIALEKIRLQAWKDFIDDIYKIIIGSK